MTAIVQLPKLAETTQDDSEVSSAWISEFRRRIDDIESGRVQMEDVASGDARIRARLAAIRNSNSSRNQ